MSDSKVLIIVGDASETLDTLYPFYRLQEDDFQPVVAGPEKKKYQMASERFKKYRVKKSRNLLSALHHFYQHAGLAI